MQSEDTDDAGSGGWNNPTCDVRLRSGANASRDADADADADDASTVTIDAGWPTTVASDDRDKVDKAVAMAKPEEANDEGGSETSS